jgi:hypothetical protein
MRLGAYPLSQSLPTLIFFTRASLVYQTTRYDAEDAKYHYWPSAGCFLKDFL